MSTPYTFEELVAKVQQWADQRGIYDSSTLEKQLDKTSSEFNELQRSIGAWNTNSQLLISKPDLDFDTCEAIMAQGLAVKKQMKDDFGDVLVTLINAAYLANINLVECLAQSLEEISARKGRMINGVFVKQSDL